VQRSIKESVSELIRERIELHGLGDEFDFTQSELKHKITGSAFIFSGLRDHTSDSLKSYQGIKYCWVEEAHTVSEKSLKVLIPTIRLEDSLFIFTYNRYLDGDPVHNLMRREIKDSPRKIDYKAHKKIYSWEQSEGLDALMLYVNAEANPYFPRVLESEMEKEKIEDENSFLHIWRGMPISQSADSVISRVDIEAACKRDIVAHGDLVCGVDVARFGDDSTVFILRRGLKVLKGLRLAKSDIINTGNRLMEFLDNDLSVTIRIDDSGVGGGLTDYMRSRNYQNVQAILFNQSPIDKNKYDMAISEMWFYFKSIINDVSIPDVPELKEELSERRYVYDRSQRRAIESKRDFKKRLGRSPDYADALLLCYYNLGSVQKISNTNYNQESRSILMETF
jgi:phage terminase large subunit